MKNKWVHTNFLGEEYQEKLLKHPTWKLKLFIKDVEEIYGVKINRWQAARAKKYALFACSKESVGTRWSVLERLCKGEILGATGRDANNQMFPVAWAIVESESKESWSWFIRHLIDDLEMQDGKGWTLLSDQQKGLMPVIAQLLPNVAHRLCARHIFTNWIKIIKGAPLHKLFWRAVKAYNEKTFLDVMQELRTQSGKAYTEMCARNVKFFCRCYYNTWASTDVTCNNMAETFNSWISEAREKPILTMLEEIRRQVMCRMVDKKAEAAKCNGIVTPRIRAKLNNFRQGTRNWRAIEANTNVYEVQHIHNSNLSYAVRLDQRKCACRYWDVNGYPCLHATTEICAKIENPESYAGIWYHKDTYQTAYSFPLEPVNGQHMWKKVEGGPILPSDARVKHGRPPNKRKISYGEAKSKKHPYRIPKSGKQFCSNCKEPGHKYKTCPQRIA
ncbi:uncharacterized protein [Spinacia oleracea]|uniref:SWIM-type domain-containing protein n=1 Tax=Spinacia oleracea TaxID=3562 RepID=A0ABM3R8D4_SPIOL|nr:uncharacterized protein LOC130467402 [Spinacia oleracea]